MKRSNYIGAILALLMVAQVGHADARLTRKYHQLHGKKISKSIINRQQLPKKISSMVASVRKKMLEEMKKKDPRGFSQLQAELKKAQSARTASQQKKQVEQAMRKHKSLIDYGSKKFKRQSEQVKKQAYRLAQNYQAKVKFYPLLGFIIEWMINNNNRQPTGDRVISDFTINGNYDMEIRKVVGANIAFPLGAGGNTSNGDTIAVGVTAYLGAITVEGGVGKLIDVPAGVDKIHIQLTTNVEASGMALALGGGSFTSHDVALEVLNGELSQVMCGESQNILSLGAPLIGLMYGDLAEPRVLTCDVPTNGQPQSVLVTVSSLVTAASAVIADNLAISEQSPFEFRVQLIDEQ